MVRISFRGFGDDEEKKKLSPSEAQRLSPTGTSIGPATAEYQRVQTELSWWKKAANRLLPAKYDFQEPDETQQVINTMNRQQDAVEGPGFVGGTKNLVLASYDKRAEMPTWFREEWERGWLRTASALETTAAVGFRKLSERQGGLMGQETLAKFYSSLSNRLESLAANDAELAKVGVEVREPQKFKDAVQDPEFIIRGVAGTLPNLLGAVLVGGGATVAGGPTAGVAATFTFSASLEGGFAYRDAKEHGMSDEEAEKVMTIVGVANGLLETLPVNRILRNLPGGNAVKKTIATRARSAIIQAVEEGSTESIQEIVSNAVAQTYDENRSLFQGVPEAALFGTITGGVVDVATGGGPVGLSIQDVSKKDKDYVPETNEVRLYNGNNNIVRDEVKTFKNPLVVDTNQEDVMRIAAEAGDPRAKDILPTTMKNPSEADAIARAFAEKMGYDAIIYRHIDSNAPWGPIPEYIDVREGTHWSTSKEQARIFSMGRTPSSVAAVKSLENAEMAIGNAYSDLQDAKAGRRLHYEEQFGYKPPENVSTSDPSTFPQWLTPKLRSRNLLNRVLAKLDSNQTKFSPLEAEVLDDMRRKVAEVSGFAAEEITNDMLTGRTGVQSLTQKDVVKVAMKDKEMSIKELVKETGYLEPNIRRIMGVGTKEGTFERIGKGVYRLRIKGQDLVYVHTGDAIEILPKLAADGLKADMVFLDIPYKTRAVMGKNRGIKYDTITPEEFLPVVDAVGGIARTADTPVIFMYSQAASGIKEMQKYIDVLYQHGLKLVARGFYEKTDKSGKALGFPGRHGYKQLDPEGILLLTKSGNFPTADIAGADLQFKFVRPKGKQSEKPRELMEALIKLTTNEGDMILDPFAGTGVTGEQAVKAGRRATLIEKKMERVTEDIIPRVEAAVQEKPISTQKRVTVPVGRGNPDHIIRFTSEQSGQKRQFHIRGNLIYNISEAKESKQPAFTIGKVKQKGLPNYVEDILSQKADNSWPGKLRSAVDEWIAAGRPKTTEQVVAAERKAGEPMPSRKELERDLDDVRRFASVYYKEIESGQDMSSASVNKFDNSVFDLPRVLHKGKMENISGYDYDGDEFGIGPQESAEWITTEELLALYEKTPVYQPNTVKESLVPDVGPTPEEEFVPITRKEPKPTKTFTIALDDGQKVEVIYHENYFGGTDKSPHFEFHGHGTSETGYKSDFLTSDGIPKGMSVEEAAKIRAEAFAKELAAKNKKRGKVAKAPKEVKETKTYPDIKPGTVIYGGEYKVGSMVGKGASLKVELIERGGKSFWTNRKGYDDFSKYGEIVTGNKVLGKSRFDRAETANMFGFGAVGDVDRIRDAMVGAWGEHLVALKALEKAADAGVPFGEKKATKPPRSPAPPEGPKRIQIAPLREPTRQITRAEDLLLRDRIRNQARGAKQAAAVERTAGKRMEKSLRREIVRTEKETRHEVRAQIIGDMRVSNANIAEIKKQIVVYAKMSLPLNERGKLLNMVANAKTQLNLWRAFARIDARAEIVRKKELIATIKGSLERIGKSDLIAVDYKDKINELLVIDYDALVIEQLSGVDLIGRREATLKKLQATRDFLKREREAGNDVFMPEEVLKRLEILDRTSAMDMTVAGLQAIVDDINRLEQMGTAKRRTIRETYEIERSMKEEELFGKFENGKPVGGIMVPIERLPYFQSLPGEIMPWAQKFKDKFRVLFNGSQHLDLAITPMDTLIDLFDGGLGTYDGPAYRLFKGALDIRWSAQSQEFQDDYDALLDKFEEIGVDILDVPTAERIGVHAYRMQAGGTDRLIQGNKLTQAQIDAIQLTPKEEEAYQYLRKWMDDHRIDVEDTLRHVFNKPLGTEKNYIPMRVQGEAVDLMLQEDRVYPDMTRVGNRPTKLTEQGFTENRLGSLLPLDLNVFQVSVEHMKNVIYFKHMSREIKMLFEIANSPDFKIAAGDRGREMMLDWMDTMARAGGAGDTSSVFDTLRKNYGAAVLAFKLSSAFLQPTSLFSAAKFVGPGVFSDAIQLTWSKDIRKFIVDTMPEIRDRFGDDPAFLEKGSWRMFNGIRQFGFKGIAILDQWAAMSTAWAAYNKRMSDLGAPVSLTNITNVISHNDAVQYAQRIVRISQASQIYKDVPLAISSGRMLTGNKSVNKALLQFQSFMLAEWSVIRNNMIRSKMFGGRREGQHWQNVDSKGAVWHVFLTFMAAVAGAGLTVASQQLVDMVTGRDDEDDDEIKEVIIRQIIGKIPFMSVFVSTSVYGSDVIPSLTSLKNLAEGAIRSQTGKEQATRLKGWIELWQAALSLAGVPGTSQGAQLIRGTIDEPSTGGGSGGRIQIRGSGGGTQGGRTRSGGSRIRIR